MHEGKSVVVLAVEVEQSGPRGLANAGQVALT